jgi:hypothetical protein
MVSRRSLEAWKITDWGLAGAEAVLRLHALIINGGLLASWRFHPDQENHRVHNATTSTGSATADKGRPHRKSHWYTEPSHSHRQLPHCRGLLTT